MMVSGLTTLTKELIKEGGTDGGSTTLSANSKQDGDKEYSDEDSEYKDENENDPQARSDANMNTGYIE